MADTTFHQKSPAEDPGPDAHQASGLAEFKAVAASVLEYGTRYLERHGPDPDAPRTTLQEQEWQHGREAALSGNPAPALAGIAQGDLVLDQAEPTGPIIAVARPRTAVGWARPAPRYAGLDDAEAAGDAVPG